MLYPSHQAASARIRTAAYFGPALLAMCPKKKTSGSGALAAVDIADSGVEALVATKCGPNSEQQTHLVVDKPEETSTGLLGGFVE